MLQGQSTVKSFLIEKIGFWEFLEDWEEHVVNENKLNPLLHSYYAMFALYPAAMTL